MVESKANEDSLIAKDEKTDQVGYFIRCRHSTLAAICAIHSESKG